MTEEHELVFVFDDIIDRICYPNGKRYKQLFDELKNSEKELFFNYLDLVPSEMKNKVKKALQYGNTSKY